MWPTNIQLKKVFLIKHTLRFYSTKKIKLKNPNYQTKRLYDWTPVNEKYNKLAGKQNQKPWIISGSVIATMVTTHFYLMNRHKIEFRRLNKEMPPIRWTKFLKEYLEQKKVIYNIFFMSLGPFNYLLYSIQHWECLHKEKN